jgi:hypothetical protein
MMAAVAARGGVGLFAVAEGYFGRLLQDDLLRVKFRPLVGAVTEGLPFGLTTGTPVIGARRQIKNRWFVIRDARRAHILCFKTARLGMRRGGVKVKAQE